MTLPKFALSKKEKEALLAGIGHDPKILIWDIEATGLNATFGTILCIGHKWLGDKKPTVISILDGPKTHMLNDKGVVERFIKVFNEADYSVSWYGDRYDMPMVRSKLLVHRLPPPAPVRSLDLWKAVRYKFKLHNNRLAAWEQYLKTPHHKTAIDFDAWLQAAHGNKAAMAEVVDHCAKDVDTLEDVYLRLRPWLSEQPNRWTITGQEGCPACGSQHIIRQGYRSTITRVYQRFQCLDCRHWFHSARSLGSAPTRSSPI